MIDEDDADEEQDDSGGEDDVVEVPITDTLDLHPFAPRDVAALVADYLGECAARGFADALATTAAVVE